MNTNLKYVTNSVAYFHIYAPTPKNSKMDNYSFIMEFFETRYQIGLVLRENDTPPDLSMLQPDAFPKSLVNTLKEGLNKKLRGMEYKDVKDRSCS